MNFNGALLFFFSALGAFNGFALSAYILVKAGRKHIANIFLALALLALSIRAAKSVFFYFDDNLAQIFIQIGIIACYLIGPFLYFFVVTVCNEQHRPPKWKYHLALLVPLILILTFSFPYYEYRNLWAYYILRGIYVLWLVYILLAARILYRTIILPKNRKKRSNTLMNWTLQVVITFFLVWLAYFTTSYTSYIVGAMTFTVIGYLLIHFILNSRKKHLFLLNDPSIPQRMNVEQDRSLMAKMDVLFQTKDIYKTSSLKCADVAKLLNVPNYQLSHAINNATGSNFNNYINTYRVEAAKNLLRENPGFTIEAIGKECGFRSKSSFYAAFKKVTGSTPSKFV